MTFDQKVKLISVIDQQLNLIDKNILLIDDTSFIQNLLILRSSIFALKEKINSSDEQNMDFKQISKNLVETTICFTDLAIKEMNNNLVEQTS